jgi:hypothetical protein
MAVQAAVVQSEANMLAHTTPSSSTDADGASSGLISNDTSNQPAASLR